MVIRKCYMWSWPLHASALLASSASFVRSRQNDKEATDKIAQSAEAGAAVLGKETCSSPDLAHQLVFKEYFVTH